MIETFLRLRAGLRCVVVIIDIRRGMQEEDRQLLEFLTAIDRRAVVVATKVDKLGSNLREPALRTLAREAGQPVLPFSSVTRVGRDELWRILVDAAGLPPTPIVKATSVKPNSTPQAKPQSKPQSKPTKMKVKTKAKARADRT
jgi:GTP-binding protein